MPAGLLMTAFSAIYQPLISLFAEMGDGRSK